MAPMMATESCMSLSPMLPKVSAFRAQLVNSPCSQSMTMA